MLKEKENEAILNDGLAKLGLASEEGSLLFFTDNKNGLASNPEIWFQLEKAALYKADAVFFVKGMRENEYIPQIYIYDYTDQALANDEELTQVHKNVWTGGEIPCVCVFSNTEIKILDTTKPIKENQHRNGFLPEYLIANLNNIAGVHAVFNTSFAQRLKSGTYWDTAKVDFNTYSSYSQLTALLRKVIDKFTNESNLSDHKTIVQKLIIQCILIKYLEERHDHNGDTVFPLAFFKKYGASEFSDVLKNGTLFTFFADLNEEDANDATKKCFNGGIFKWDDKERALLEGKLNAFYYLANVLQGYLDTGDQLLIQFEDNFSRLYAFNYIPVELISRLYEEFIIKAKKDEPKKKNEHEGVAYTPSHLVRLLVNEVMPVSGAPQSLTDFKVLDPACGSAIFLVVAFKRLVQWWRQQNNYQKPTLIDLKRLLNAVYGVDLDPRAVQISVFSLCIALCDELSPKEIWNDLKFDHLEGNSIFHNDFFLWQKNNQLKFDVIIGNPPFIRGVGKELNRWKVNEALTIDIPQNQIALKFLAESVSLLKESGVSCLIVKASNLLYSHSDASKEYLKVLSQNFHINQIFDFTPLARNGVLWDGVDVDTAAIFVTNTEPDFNKNVLHAVFRRTKANKERIYFEIDKYDLHYVLRRDVYENPYIFKTNLLGGGRLKSLINKCVNCISLETYLKENKCDAKEGLKSGNQEKVNKRADFVYDYKHLPTTAFQEEYVDFEKLTNISRIEKFESIPSKAIFEYPNVIIKENIGKRKIPVMLNEDQCFTFKMNLIGIYSFIKDIKPLKHIYQSFKVNNELYRLFIIATSAQMLINKNTVCLREDIIHLPMPDESFKLLISERNVISDALTYTQYFLRTPETALALQYIKNKNLAKEIGFYGKCFADAINELYADKGNSFKLTDIISFHGGAMIGALFSYDEGDNVIPQLRTENEVKGIDGLINFDINESLSATRVIQYYASGKVLFVKPNQKRFWLASIAYRDADSVFADILNKH